MVPGLLTESLCRYIGRTVTIFTTSGGISGAGFTGVLACVGECTIKLITDIGAPPACPIGNTCGWGYGNSCGFGNGIGFGSGVGFGVGFGTGLNGWGSSCGCGCGGGWGNWSGGNWLGSITEIPIDRIACFTHSAI